MVQADLSGISYFLPILSFLIVFIIVYAVLKKIELIKEQWVNIFVSFILATIFVSVVGARDYVVNIVPWFAILFVSLFLILLILGLVGKQVDFLHKGIGIAFVVATVLMFFISAIFVFSDYFSPYLPWNNGYGANPDVLTITGWFFSGRVLGAILLLVVSAVVSWVLVNAKK